MKILTFLSIFLFVTISCQHPTDQPDRVKNEVINTEKEFATMAEKSGIAQAFLYFADQNAVLERNNTLIKGKASLKTYFDHQHFSDTKLSWTPTLLM
jgi:hypothetical protein